MKKKDLPNRVKKAQPLRRVATPAPFGTPPIPAGRGIKYQPPRSATTPPIPSGRGRDEKLTSLRVWSWGLVVLFVLILLYGCTMTKYVPVTQIRHEKVVEYDTIFEITTPEEVVVNTTTDTVSELRTTYAHSVAKVEGGVLTHTLTQPARRDSAKGKQRIVYVVDSIPYAVEVEKTKEVVPAWCWWSLAVAGICVAGTTLFIIGNIKKE